MRPCKRGHHAGRDRKGDCLACKKQRDDRHRLEARLAGKDAERQLRWWHKRMEDPEFREKQRLRYAARRDETRLCLRLGIGARLARDIRKVTG